MVWLLSNAYTKFLLRKSAYHSALLLCTTHSDDQGQNIGTLWQALPVVWPGGIPVPRLLSFSVGLL